MSDADGLKEEFIHLQENQRCETKFRALSLSHFWCDQLVAYPGLVRAAMKMTTPFPTIYLCEKAFSTMLLIKTTAGNRLYGDLLHSINMGLATQCHDIKNWLHLTKNKNRINEGILN